MTDPELLAKKLAQIETCVAELRTLARPERIVYTDAFSDAEGNVNQAMPLTRSCR